MIHGATPFSSQTEEELKKELRRPLNIGRCDEKVMSLIAGCLCYEVDRRWNLPILLAETKLVIAHL
jgi:hypothetical protein